jgi:hypothetical protein
MEAKKLVSEAIKASALLKSIFRHSSNKRHKPIRIKTFYT